MSHTFGKIELRPYQGEAHDITVDYIRKQIANYKDSGTQPEPAIVEGYVGCGKSMLIGAIASHCHQKGLKCMIITRTGELVKQDAEECFNMDAPVSIYSASLGCKSTYYSTVAGSEGTVANAIGTDFASWLPLVILIDEAQQCSWQDVMEGGESQFARVINHFNQLADRMQLENPRKVIPRPIIIGYTGTPYRGLESIIGPYWKEIIYSIGREFLVSNEYLVPTIFGYGHDDVKYDLDDFEAMHDEGTEDFTNQQLIQMHKKMNLTATHKIMKEVINLTKDRLGVLITCAGLKHCMEAAEALPEGTWAIVTGETPAKERIDILDKAKSGALKYILQVNCLGVGVNVPRWDTSVILRRIGSLTLLVQLLGRGMRLLKDEHIAAGLVKTDHLVLDYAGTMPSMIKLFNDPLLDDAELSRAREAHEIIHCPKCGTENSEHARRCIGRDNSGERCDHFWKSRVCEDLRRGDMLISKGCGTENDVAARYCRHCENLLIDYNAQLGKHYTDDDWKPVLEMKLEITGKNQDGIKVAYFLDSHDLDGKQEVAVVNYWAINAGGNRIWKSKFLDKHVLGGWGMVGKLNKMPPVEIMANLRLFKMPEKVTHRINAKGESIVNF